MVVVDLFHLLLRIADLLINLLIVELRRLDLIKDDRAVGRFNIQSFPHLKAYQELMKDIGVRNFSFSLGDKEAKVEGSNRSRAAEVA